MAGNVYAISDPHHGHVNMAMKRGFSDVNKHNQHIIDNINIVCDKRDVLYILGDLTMEKSGKALWWLNDLLPRLKFVLGNHDKPTKVAELFQYSQWIAGIAKVKGYWLTHCPIHPQEFYRVKANIHGHVHENSILTNIKDYQHQGMKYDPRYINVSMEAVNYKPFQII